MSFTTKRFLGLKLISIFALQTNRSALFI